MSRLQYKYCEPYSAPFRRYIQRVAHISIPKSLLRHFTALERQRVRLGRIQAFIETDDPRFRTILAHYLNYLNEQVHFRRRPEAHVYSHLKADAQDFIYDIRDSHYAARAYCARSPWGSMGATADYAIWLNAHAFTPKAFLATMRALFGPIGQCPGTIILVQTAPTRRKLIRLFAANRPDSWVTHPCPPPKPHRYKYPVFPKDHRPPMRRGLSRLERLQLLFPWMTSLPPKRPLIRYPLPPNPNAGNGRERERAWECRRVLARHWMTKGGVGGRRSPPTPPDDNQRRWEGEAASCEPSKRQTFHHPRSIIISLPPSRCPRHRIAGQSPAGRASQTLRSRVQIKPMSRGVPHTPCEPMLHHRSIIPASLRSLPPTL